MTGALPKAAEPRGTVYLVNQFSRHGHLDLYARLYSACALELGYRVVLIAHGESGEREWLRHQHPELAGSFRFFSRDALDGRRFWGWATRFMRNRRGAARLARLGMTLGLIPRQGVSFAPLVREVLAAEERTGWPASLVFFLYLDMMSDDARGRRSLDRRLKRPWAGILFHPRFDGKRGPEGYFAARTARGAAFLNPHCVEAYQNALPGRHFGEVPDVTDPTLPPNRPEVASRFTELAKGRTIVGLIGSITGDKGLPEYLDVIARADASRFFFVIVGEVFWDSLGGDVAAIRRFMSEPPEHCFVSLGYVEDERDLNAIMAATDILYAVYPNQRDSSNTLAKAALLEKPVVVNEAHLMGERVRAFDIGAAVATDAGAILGALDRLRNIPRSEFGFEAYRKAHSRAALRASFGALIERWLPAA